MSRETLKDILLCIFACITMMSLSYCSSHQTYLSVKEVHCKVIK